MSPRNKHSQIDLYPSHTVEIPDGIIQQWKEAETEPFSGWDFSQIRGKRVEDNPPISYMDEVRELLADSTAVLDIGTGGGERLLELRDALPSRVAATEGYAPNFELARTNLEPHGIEVKFADTSLDAKLPFPDASFDLVISRHSAYNISEIERVLVPGGIFYTKQVEGTSGHDLADAFGEELKWTFFTHEFMVNDVSKTDLRIESSLDWSGKVRYDSMETLIYYLKAVPWTVDDFSVESHLPYLLKLYDTLTEIGYLEFGVRYLFMKVRKSLKS